MLKNKLEAINTLAKLILKYTFNVINWNLEKIWKIDQRIGKMISIYKMHHPKADVDGR